MKTTLAAIIVSAFLTTHASARMNVNELGYPFSAPEDFGAGQGDLSWEQIYADDMAKEIMQKVRNKISESKTSDEVITFLTNPMIREYLIRETRTWEELSGPVVKSYITTASMLDNRTGVDFKAMFTPDPSKALNLISLGRYILPEEAKASYLLNPVRENGYLSEDQKLEVLQYIKDNFSIPQQSVQQYMGVTRNFETS